MDALGETAGHYDGSTNLPVPLSFERVVREYVGDFPLAEVDEDRDDGEDGGEDDA